MFILKMILLQDSLASILIIIIIIIIIIINISAVFNLSRVSNP